jgi:hypothetical protein
MSKGVSILPPPLRKVSFFPPPPSGTVDFYFPQENEPYRVVSLFAAGFAIGVGLTANIFVGIQQSGVDGYGTSQILCNTQLSFGNQLNWFVAPNIAIGSVLDQVGEIDAQDPIPPDMIVMPGERLYLRIIPTAIDPSITWGVLILTTAPG